jgi:hypothetical protein
VKREASVISRKSDSPPPTTRGAHTSVARAQSETDFKPIIAHWQSPHTGNHRTLAITTHLQSPITLMAGRNRRHARKLGMRTISIHTKGKPKQKPIRLNGQAAIDAYERTVAEERRAFDEKRRALRHSLPFGSKLSGLKIQAQNGPIDDEFDTGIANDDWSDSDSEVEKADIDAEGFLEELSKSRYAEKCRRRETVWSAVRQKWATIMATQHAQPCHSDCRKGPNITIWLISFSGTALQARLQLNQCHLD